MKRLLRVLPVFAIVLTGCDDVSERDCGIFNHPELALWQSDTGAATATYMSSEGLSITFNRQSITLNEPFLGTDGSSNDEDVICELSATVRMQATDNSLAITSTYLQEEKFLLDATDETLLVNHRVESPVGTELIGGFAADISDAAIRLNLNSNRVQYLEEGQTTAEFNGQAYEDVIRIAAPGVTLEVPDADSEASDVTVPNSETSNESDTTINAETDNATDNTISVAADAIKQIVLARDVGIVAFVDAQDREFVLVAQ